MHAASDRLAAMQHCMVLISLPYADCQDSTCYR